MKKLTGLAIVAGAVTVAIMIGNSMSSDAMAVIIGVVFGVAASIPTSLLIVAATRGRRQEAPRLSPDPRPQIYVMPQYPWPQQQQPPQILGPQVTGGGKFELLEGYGDEQQTIYADARWH